MKALKLTKAVFAMTILAVGALVGSALPSPGPVKRLDLFDAQGNSLMFVNFEYDATGKNTAYTVYFSDSTFTRRVIVAQNAAGICTTETAVNFTEDTVFKSSFTPNGANMDILVKDQFKVDQFGGKVNYSKSTNANEYNFFQNGSQTNRMKYEYNAAGRLKIVNVFDAAGNLSYYGIFDSSNVGVLMPQEKRFAPRPSLTLRGNDALSWSFTIDHAANVKCEALSIGGRRVAVLYDGNLPSGYHSKIIRLGPVHSLTNGVYVAKMSVDDKSVATTKFIIQRAGGAR
jgi:hypothetical protein